jgi:hypothetical protein
MSEIPTDWEAHTNPVEPDLFQRGYDKGFEDGQIVSQHSEAIWSWALLFGGMAFGLMLPWVLRHFP